MDEQDFIKSTDEQYVSAVRNATHLTFEVCRDGDLADVYLTPAWELQRRGIDPEPPTVFDAALLIARQATGGASHRPVRPTKRPPTKRRADMSDTREGRPQHAR
jgi:hypothetical protein